MCTFLNSIPISFTYNYKNKCKYKNKICNFILKNMT